MKNRFTLNCLSLMISSLLLLPAVNSHAGETTRVSVDSSGQQGNSDDTGYSPDISADGRFVAFSSTASNLVTGDTNHSADIFVHDRSTGATTRVSVDSAGQQANYSSFDPAISADGRFVTFYSGASNLAGNTNYIGVFVHDRSTGATSHISVDSAGQPGNSYSYGSAISADGRYVSFESAASNLVAGDTNEYHDAFVHDRFTGATTRVSVDSAGVQGNDGSYQSSISANGRFVTFTSSSTNLVAEDTNAFYDVFVYDRAIGETSRVSVDSAGQQGNERSGSPAISADGRFVAFESDATNLVAGDTNATWDIFVHDRSTGATTRVSVDSTGQQGNMTSSLAAISADGRFVTFWSVASNLVPGDTNGYTDVFVHDRSTGATTRINVGSAGQPGNLGGTLAFPPAISADGRFVAFNSADSNLVAGDTNRYSDTFVRDRQLIRHKTADLQLTVASQPVSVQTGQTASYAYTLTNNGPDSIDTEVKLTDVISEGRVISLTPSQGSCKKAAVSVCRFGSLATGASVTLTAEIKAGSDPLTQQLSVNAPPVDNVPDNNSLTVSTPVTP